MRIRLLSDWVLVEVEKPTERNRAGIIIPGSQPVRWARVLAVGPGRWRWNGTREPLELKVGERFPFFKAVTETQQGLQFSMLLDDNQALVRESDVLFVLDEGEVEVSI